MIDMNSVAERMYPGMSRGEAPAPFRPAPSQPAPAPIARASSYDDLAARMPYKTSPSVRNDHEPLPGSMQERADRMPYEQNGPDTPEQFAEISPIPDDILALRESDGARRLYSPQKIFADVLPVDMIDEEVPVSLKAAVIGELREMAADIGASTQDVANLRSISNNLPEEVSHEQRVAWHEEAVDLLNAEFGQTAATAFKDANRLVRRDPRLAAIFSGGLGDHPQAVLTMARLARTARLNGKLNPNLEKKP